LVTEMKFGTRTIRADLLALGDVVALPSVVKPGLVELHEVTSLSREGDDVVVNGTVTTSRGNHMTVIYHNPYQVDL
jgi:hypothetical protein